MRVVLDTAVVVSALLFEAGRLSYLRDAWTAGRLVPLVSRDTTTELLRVLGYPKFDLSPEEVQHFLSCVPCCKARTVLTVCYAAGLRISEAVALKPTEIDSQRMTIRVTQGKGHKDRPVPLTE